jgi:membrane-associated phospholipid phosphatase
MRRCIDKKYSGRKQMIFRWKGAMRLRGIAVLSSVGCGLALMLMAARPAAAASVPWTPSLEARHAIEVLVDDGGLALTVSQWPLPRDAVQQALDALPAALSPALAAARDRVQAELRAQQHGRLAVTVRQRADALAGFGDDATPGSSLQLRTGELDGPHLVMQIGGRLDPVSDTGQYRATARLDDSAVAVDAFGFQAQAWAHRSWWGPGWQSALPLSNNAPAFDGIGFQRASASQSESPWLSWLGPWNLDFFLARSEGELTSAVGSDALISGTRLTFKPFSHLELGITRMVQFGGQGHPETLGSFAKAVVGSHANAQNLKGQSLDSGNGLAGVDIRVRCPDAVRCAAYGQFIGEDDRKHLPYKFLNLLGTEVWSADGVTRFYFEAAEIGCRNTFKGASIPDCAYRNYAFPGYTSGNRWIGASIGSDGHLLTLGWINSEWDSAFRVDFGRVGSSIGTLASADAASSAGRLWALSARRSWHVGSASLTPEFDWNHVATATGVRVESRFGLEMSMSLDDLGRLSPSQFADRLSAAGKDSTTVRLLAATALIGGASLFDRAANNYAYDHRREPSLKVLRDVGSALPYAEFGLAGAAWLARRGSSDGDVALASVEAGLTSVAMAEVLKLGVDRSRPLEGRGATDFGHEKRSDSSFPSIHSTLAWSVLTPIAQRYDAPWLYGVAALTNFARVSGRNHWLSDTVAGSVLGYVVGDWFGRRVDASGNATGSTVMLMPRGVAMSTTFR